MIKPHIPPYFEMNEQAICELVLLISLLDCGDDTHAKEILHNVREKRLFRYSTTQLTYPLQFSLPMKGYADRDDGYYSITKKGMVRLRDLCELVHANPSTVTQLNEEGFDYVVRLRQTMGMYPFTNGRLTSVGPKIREIKDHCVYAVLLSERAFQIRYRIKNPQHNVKMPCLYVGMSQYSPLQRFDNHRFGSKSKRSNYVDMNGLCLVPLIYSHLNKQKMSKNEALQVEKEFAVALREVGFAVFAGHHDVTTPPVKNGMNNRRTVTQRTVKNKR